MLLGGLWHGANWTFVCWGGLHGIYLIVNHGWDVIASRASIVARLRATYFWRIAAWFLTFIAVVIGWVFFRSPDFSTAIHLLNGMAGATERFCRTHCFRCLSRLRSALSAIGITFGFGSGATFVSTYLWVLRYSLSLWRCRIHKSCWRGLALHSAVGVGRTPRQFFTAAGRFHLAGRLHLEQSPSSA